MNIAIISHSYPQISGVHGGIYVQDQVELLREDHHVQVLVPVARGTSAPSHLPEEVIPVKYLSPGGTRWPAIRANRLGNALIQKLRSLDSPPDWIHAHFGFPAGLALRSLHEEGYNRLVLSFHGSDWYTLLDQPKLLTRIKAGADSCNGITVPSASLKNDILERWPDLKPPVEVLGNYVDDRLFREITKERKIQAGKALGWEPNRRHWITVANWVPAKGVDLLLTATNSLESKQPMTVHIVGKQSDDTYASKIKSLVQQSPHKIELQAPVPREELAQMYAASDCYVQASRFEGGGIALMEAICSGLPVVATRTGGAPDLVDEANGLLVEPENVEQLREALASALNKDYWPGLRSAGQKVVARYGRETFKQRLLRLYQDGGTPS
ncbi:MAG: glycosyltransferase family 4 protein [Bacteroidota bacterium]